MNEIVQLTQDKVALLLRWAESEGWNPGLDDAKAFFSADPQGYLGLEISKELVAAISVVRQSDSQAFLGLYICQPGSRGKGHGWAVWQAGMDLMQGRTVGLDGVVEQQANYAKSGFAMAWRNRRFSGVIDYSQTHKGVEPRDYDAGDLQAVIAYDLSVGGVIRKEFLTHWLSGTNTRKTLVAYNDAKLCGVVTIRQCVEGFKIGPLLADDAAIANSLIIAAARKLSAKQIFIDVPETNEDANRLVELMNFQAVFETARMYCGDAPEFDHSRLFGIATLELG